MNIIDPKIENYAQLHSDAEPPLLEELRKETEATMEFPQMLSGPLQGQLLKQIAAMIQAKRILEIGTFTGYSALCFAEGMAAGGTITTLDINLQAIAIARRYFERSYFARQIIIKEGPALEVLKTIESVPSFDLAFIDADKENYIHYYNAVLSMVRKNGIILVDNVLWSGRVLNPQDDKDKAIVAFNNFVKGDERVSKVMVTLRDGIYILRKK